MNRIILECPHCQSCFNASEWLEQYSVTNELYKYWSGKDSVIPEFESEEEIYKYLLEEEARMDCPDCGEVCCIEDLTEV